jgi:hypothetical protein
LEFEVFDFEFVWDFLFVILKIFFRSPGVSPMIRRTAALLAVLVLVPITHADEPKKEAVFPKFEMQEIANDLGVGYAVLLVDVNGDGKKDIVVVDQKRVVWYENPTWKRRIIIENQTKPDNVCIAAYDIDGDGQIDFALGADWRPFDTKSGGTIQWLKRGKTLDEKWTVYPIGEEPTVHRMRFVNIDGSGKPHLVVTPLMGRNSTQKANWMDGSPVRILAYKIPKDPTKDRWVPEPLDLGKVPLHVVHNFCRLDSAKRPSLLLASYEGVSWWTPNLMFVNLGTGNQANPQSNRGASEVKKGTLKGDSAFVATIEPWHGDQVVVYRPHEDLHQFPWARNVIDESLKWGHAVWCADLDGDKNDEIIIGVRDDKSEKPGERRGVRLYKALDDKGAKWARHILDNGGIAVEDLAAADLDGDGKIDIVAVGRQTHNIRIYWNKGTK